MRIPGKIPITIHPAFWIFSALIGFFLSDGDILWMFIWIGIIFGSVLFHEFGHALMALLFGRRPRIDLVAMGGLTYYEGEKLPFWKQFLITLNGPLFGFLLVVGATFLIAQGYTSLVIQKIRLVNFIWTIVNLLPVLPLDGGQLLRIALERFFHAKGIRYALMASACIAFAASLLFFVTQNLFAGAIFFLFAFENFEGFRRSKGLRDTDQDERFKQELALAEMELRQGQKEKALHDFEHLREVSKEGMIHLLASQYAAFLSCEFGKTKEAYQMLLPLKERLEPEALLLLHRLAFDENNFSLVVELGGPAFQIAAQAEVALRNAYAAAALSQVESTIGWLQAALHCGVANLKEILLEKNFDPIRNDPAFQAFVSKM